MEEKLLVTRKDGQEQHFTVYFVGYPKKERKFIIGKTGIAESIGSADRLGTKYVKHSNKCRECLFRVNCDLRVEVDQLGRFAEVRGTCFNTDKNRQSMYPNTDKGYNPVKFSTSHTQKDKLEIITCPDFGDTVNKLIKERITQSKRCLTCGLQVSYQTWNNSLNVRGKCKAEEKK